MLLTKGTKAQIISVLLAFITIPTLSNASQENPINAVVANQIFEKARKNENWKLAFATGKSAQVVFMNISSGTNPKNEIGMETHTFDQIIFVTEGNGKAILNGKSSMVNSGDMIFIPEGVEHNVINLNASKPLKILSVYTATDIPAKAVYKNKADAAHE